MTLIVIAVGMALLLSVVMWLVLNQTAATRGEVQATESVILSSLKSKVVEFTAKNKRLPTSLEFLTVAAGLTDRLGRAPIYLYSSPLAASDICSSTTAFISIWECGADATCTNPTKTDNVPFVLLTTGDSVANPSAIVSQTTTATGTGEVSSANVLTRFAPGISIGSQVNRALEVSSYDDTLIAASLAELWQAAGCHVQTQGDVANRGASVRILNTPGALPPATLGILYDADSPTFIAYGSDNSTFSWSATGLPPGLEITPNTPPSPPLPSKTAKLTGTPTAAGDFNNVKITVVATSPSGNTPSSDLLMTLVVCPFSVATGNTQTLSCAPGFTGSIVQNEFRNCVGVTQWITQSDTCVAIPTSIEATFTESDLTTAGISSNQRNLGTSSITVNGVTITAGSTATTFGDRNISIDSTTATTALGVIGAGPSITQTEALKFDFSAAHNSASVVFKSLGVSGPDQAIIAFYSAGTLVGNTTLTSCSNNTFVAFNDLVPGVPFDTFTVTPSGTASFYVAGVKACSGASCPTSLTATPCL